MTEADLREQVAIDFEAMRLQVQEVQNLLRSIGDRAPTAVEKAAAGAFLGQIFGGMENTLKRFCRRFDVPLPEGPQWHRDLLDLFGGREGSSLPKLLPPDSASAMDEYRRFRHLFIHGYAVTLDWDRLRPLAEAAPETFEAFMARVEAHLAEVP